MYIAFDVIYMSPKIVAFKSNNNNSKTEESIINQMMELNPDLNIEGKIVIQQNKT